MPARPATDLRSVPGFVQKVPLLFSVARGRRPERQQSKHNPTAKANEAKHRRLLGTNHWAVPNGVLEAVAQASSLRLEKPGEIMPDLRSSLARPCLGLPSRPLRNCPTDGVLAGQRRPRPATGVVPLARTFLAGNLAKIKSIMEILIMARAGGANRPSGRQASSRCKSNGYGGRGPAPATRPWPEEEPAYVLA